MHEMIKLISYFLQLTISALFIVHFEAVSGYISSRSEVFFSVIRCEAYRTKHQGP